MTIADYREIVKSKLKVGQEINIVKKSNGNIINKQKVKVIGFYRDIVALEVGKITESYSYPEMYEMMKGVK